MSTSVPPRNDEPSDASPYRLPLADEQSLRRVFDETFPALITEAQAHLGDSPSLAPRVVEGAFVCAWQEREELRGPSQLRSYLSAEVQHGAVRALSRKSAAHRMGGSGAHATPHSAPAGGAAAHVVVDPEESWSHVTRAIHKEGHSPEAIAEAVQHSRHAAAEHTAAIAKPRSWKGPAAIGVLSVIAVVAATRWVGAAGSDAAIARAVNSAEARIVSSVPGTGAVVTLNDSTRVTLAPDSKLSIPKNFGPEVRAVKLDGAATFEPRAGAGMPLEVHTRDAIVRADAAGGRFSVRGWSADDATTVHARSGAVTLRVGDESHALAAGATRAVARGGALRTPAADEVAGAMGWMNDSLVVVNKPLRAALAELTRWYGMDVKVPDSSLLTRPVTFRAPLTSSRLAVSGIEQSGGVTYGYEGRDPAFRDARAAGGVAARP